MSIQYSLVARGPVVLAEFSNFVGNAAVISRTIMSRIPLDKQQTLSFVYDENHAFHFQVEPANMLLYMCMCDKTFPRSRAISFLNKIKTEFEKEYSPEIIRNCVAFAMNTEFSKVLNQEMITFTQGGGDKLSVLKKQVDDTKEIMFQNIEQILQRGEKIDLLVESAEALEVQSFQYKKQSKDLYCAVIMKNIKLIILCAIVIIFFLWLGSSLICGFRYECITTFI
eukprot:TRINITY_DN3565_c0_g1_i1.p1 TRINITY_DN3565_c0_g1~~TRINITY_DN3565_c0_g1_i1.p1  ORF type:complete len:240 (-),score=124.47 TRINITY_DN3565_c0_g1_i1:72-746(-)